MPAEGKIFLRERALILTKKKRKRRRKTRIRTRRSLSLKDLRAMDLNRATIFLTILSPQLEKMAIQADTSLIMELLLIRNKRVK